MKRVVNPGLLFFIGISLAAQQPPARPIDPAPNRRPFELLVAIQGRNESAILARPGVRAFGIGEDHNDLVFRVFIAGEVPPPNLPAQIEGIPVLTVPIGPITALTGLMGTSTSNPNGCYSGTLGLRVIDNSNPTRDGYVTNNHVAVASGIGCPNGTSIGTKQYSPSTQDNSCNTATEIGKLNRFITIDFAAAAVNRVDAAFVERSGVGPDERTDCGLCFPPTAIVTPLAILGGAVRKCGRTTHLTSGTVIAINTTVVISYPSCGNGKFDGQIVVTGSPQPFSQHGDSGSAVYAANGVVGLLFAGDSTGTAFLNPIADVFSKLNVTIGAVASCATSGNDSTSGVGNGAAPRVYLGPGGTEMLVAASGGTLFKFMSPGGTGHNLFAIEKTAGAWSSRSCYNYLIGWQQFPAEIRDVDFVGGFTFVALADGRIVKVNGTGGSGQNMFAINVAAAGFTSVPGFPYYVGSHKFSSGIADVTQVGGELLVSFDDGRLLKIAGSGGSGFNLFAINDSGSSFSSVPNFHYYIGDQALASGVTSVASIGGTLLVATANGKLLKVNATGGTGHNMFAITSTASGYDRLGTFPYYSGDQKLSAVVRRIVAAGSDTFLAFSDGRLLKIKNTGGTGHNMFAISDNGNSFSSVPNFTYYTGDQKVSSPATAVASIGGQFIAGFANGKMLKVTGTGGTGHNMFAVQETSNGFAAVSNPTTYLLGSTNLGAAIADVASLGGYTWVGVGNGKLLKINGNGGTGLNMFAVAQNPTDFSGLCGFSYLAGSQSFN